MPTGRERDRLYKSGVGLLLILSLIAILVILRMYQQTAGPLHQTLAIHAKLPRADGLLVDTPVTLAGLKVGRVSGVTLGDDNLVRLDLAVAARVADRIREDSRAYVHRPLIGSAYIDIGIGSVERPALTDGQQIEAVRVPDLNDLVVTLPARLAAVDAILENARTLTSDLHRATQTLTGEDGVIERSFDEISAAAIRASEAAGRLNQTLDEIRQVVVASGKSIEAANVTLGEAGALVDDLRPLGPRATDMAASLERALQNIEALSQELRDLAPQIASAMAAGQDALEETDDVMRAAQGSFLLRGNLPPPAEPPIVPAARP